jgi:aldose 1-epimerase
MAFSLNSRFWGQLPGGETVEAWTLKSPGGLELEAITYGGIVTRLLVPDREGRLADVVLGFNDLRSYLAGPPYFGAITGRVAGRITGAQFDLEGKTYQLVRNDPPNHLHGGLSGFDKKIWTATPMAARGGECSLRLDYRSLDGEEGYPGTVDVSVTYTLTSDNTFVIETEAVTDTPTPFNLTHHSYFNLAGEASASITGHELQIDSDQYVVTDEHMTLLGRYASVVGQSNDFRKGQRLGAAIPQLFRNHGDLYRIRKPSADHPSHELVSAARLVDPDTGRALNISTTESHLQLYISGALDGSLVGKSGVPYVKHAAVCLECHGYPDGANATSFCDNILRPGLPRRHITKYAFSTVDIDRTSTTRLENLHGTEEYSRVNAVANFASSRTHFGSQL